MVGESGWHGRAFSGTKAAQLEAMRVIFNFYCRIIIVCCVTTLLVFGFNNKAFLPVLVSPLPQSGLLWSKKEGRGGVFNFFKVQPIKPCDPSSELEYGCGP